MLITNGLSQNNSETDDSQNLTWQWEDLLLQSGTQVANCNKKYLLNYYENTIRNTSNKSHCSKKHFLRLLEENK